MDRGTADQPSTAVQDIDPFANGLRPNERAMLMALIKARDAARPATRLSPSFSATRLRGRNPPPG